MRAQLLEAVSAETRSAATGYAFAIAEWVNAKAQLVRAAKPAIAAADAEKQFRLLAGAGGFDLVYAGYPDQRTAFSEPQQLPPGYDPTARPWYKDATSAGEASVIVTKPYQDAASLPTSSSIASSRKSWPSGSTAMASRSCCIRTARSLSIRWRKRS